MPAPLIGVTIDCSDLERSSRFWAAALGFDDRGSDPDGRFRTLFGPRNARGLHHVTLQRVPEAKQQKNRVHLDLYVPGLDAEVERLYLLGALIVRRDAGTGGPYPSVVMADPDGNEFCLIEMPAGR